MVNCKIKEIRDIILHIISEPVISIFMTSSALNKWFYIHYVCLILKQVTGINSGIELLQTSEELTVKPWMIIYHNNKKFIFMSTYKIKMSVEIT